MNRQGRWLPAFLAGALAICGFAVTAAELPTPLPAQEANIVAPDLRSAALMSEAGTNSNEVLLAAYAAMGAYESEWNELPARALTRAGYEVSYHDTGKERFLIATRLIDGSPYTVVAISGTERKTDLKTNLADSLKEIVSIPGARVHAGYWEAAQRIMATDAFGRAAANGGRLLLTGHSLGGSVALVIGLEGKRGGTLPERTKVITFAAPAFADAAVWEQAKDLVTVNYTMNADVLPNVFRLLKAGYHANPNSIQWDSHTPPVKIPHSMIRFLDEAFYQAAMLFPAHLQAEEPADIYLATAPVTSTLEISVPLCRAYANTVIHTTGLQWQARLYRDYCPQTREEALAAARSKGAKYLLWLPVRVLSERTSQNRTYALAFSPQWIRTADGAVLSWEEKIFSNAAYTVFPVLADEAGRLTLLSEIAADLAAH